MNPILKFHVGEKVKIAYPTHEHRLEGFDHAKGVVTDLPDQIGRYVVEVECGEYDDSGESYLEYVYFQGFELERVQEDD